MKKQEAGFTLVELAIVMIIIGLLIGGVLKGQELIQNARVNATISELKGYQAAHLAFIDSYGGVAGDLKTADTRLKGCEAGNSNFCTAGDGDSLVGDIVTRALANDDVSGTNENTQFWKHLALADLITGINPAADPTLPIWRETHPTAAITGGYQVYYRARPPPTGRVRYIGRSWEDNGHIMRMQVNAFGSVDTNANGAGAISPHMLEQLDRKMDDGKPMTGIIMGLDGRGGVSNCEGDTRGGGDRNTYGRRDEGDMKRKDCILMFKFGG